LHLEKKNNRVALGAAIFVFVMIAVFGIISLPEDNTETGPADGSSQVIADESNAGIPSPSQNTSGQQDLAPAISNPASKAYSLDTKAEFNNLGFKVDGTWRLESDDGGDNYYFEGGRANDFNGFLTLVNWFNDYDMGKTNLAESDLGVMKQFITDSVASVSFSGEPERVNVAGKDGWLLSYEGIYSDESEGITETPMHMENLFFIDNEQILRMIWVGAPLGSKDEYKDLLREFRNCKIITCEYG